MFPPNFYPLTEREGQRSQRKANSSHGKYINHLLRMASQSTLYNNNTKESFFENIFRRLIKLISLELSPFFNLNQKWLKIAQDFSHISTCFFAPQSPFLWSRSLIKLRSSLLVILWLWCKLSIYLTYLYRVFALAP